MVNDVEVTAIVGVCDEHELIERCLSHLESIKVSIVVVDNGSQDSTLDILLRYQHEDRIHLIRNTAERDRGTYYLTQGLRYAKDRLHPDWVFFQDADEFWYCGQPFGARLASTEPSVFAAPRYNACVTPYLLEALGKDPTTALDPALLDVHIEALVLDPDSMSGESAPAWITAPDAGKIIASTQLIDSVTNGAHSVYAADGTHLLSNLPESIIIVHIPFSSFARFERKVRNAQRLMERHPDLFPGLTAWHWRRWIDLLKAGRLRDEYDLQIMDSATLAAKRSDGLVASVAHLL